jgi:hypothetical protein
MSYSTKSIVGLLGLFLLLCSFQQVDTISRKVDSALQLSDSTFHKDTLMIQYVPIIPKTFQLADASYFISTHANLLDSNFNILKEYKKYYTNKKNAYRLYNGQIAKSDVGELIFKIEQRFALPDKDLLFYSILLLLFLYGFVNNTYPQYFPKLFSQFSQSSLRMLQQREQLLQNSLASLIMNICFILIV